MLKWIVFWESVWARERNGFADYQNCRSGFYWLEAHMGAPQLHYTPLIWLNWRAWKIKQFDRFDTFFFISCALRLLKSDFFLDRWRDDGNTIATMFNQKLSMNAHNSPQQSKARDKNLISHSLLSLHVGGALAVLIALHNSSDFYALITERKIYFLPLVACVVSWSLFRAKPTNLITTMKMIR